MVVVTVKSKCIYAEIQYLCIVARRGNCQKVTPLILGTARRGSCQKVTTAILGIQKALLLSNRSAGCYNVVPAMKKEEVGLVFLYSTKVGLGTANVLSNDNGAGWPQTC